MTYSEFIASALSTVATILALVGTAATSYAIAYFKMKRLEAVKRIEELDRATLKSAVSTSLQADLSVDPLASNPELITSAAKYILSKGAPDAAKAFDMTPADLGRLVVSKVGEERAKLAAEALKPC